MEQQPSYWSVTPASVRYCKDLSSSAKLLYGEISALTNSTGYCYAKNEYFAKLYDVKDRQITRWVKELKDAGFIEDTGDSKKGDRKLRLLEYLPPSKKTEGVDKKDGDTPVKKDGENNTEENRTSNSGELFSDEDVEGMEWKCPETLLPLPFKTETFQKAWDAFRVHRKELKKKLTKGAAQLIFNKLKGCMEQVAIDAIYRAIESRWTSVYPPEMESSNPRPATPAQQRQRIAFREEDYR